MAKRSKEKQAQLKANYAKLRDAGYSPKEASRLRSSSPDTIKKALSSTPKQFREVKPYSTRHARAGGGMGTRHKKKDTFQAAPNPYKVHKGRIKNSDYQEITPQSERQYQNQWAYKMTYVVVDHNGIEQRKYFTILPDEKMSKSELKAFVWNQCKEANQAGAYMQKAIKSSIELIGIYHNPDYD